MIKDRELALNSSTSRADKKIYKSQVHTARTLKAQIDPEITRLKALSPDHTIASPSGPDAIHFDNIRKQNKASKIYHEVYHPASGLSSINKQTSKGGAPTLETKFLNAPNPEWTPKQNPKQAPAGKTSIFPKFINKKTLGIAGGVGALGVGAYYAHKYLKNKNKN